MSTPRETTDNIWVLSALILWAFSPALVITASILGGWNSIDYSRNSPSPSNFDISPVGQTIVSAGPLGGSILMIGLIGMPIILYPWCIVALQRFDVKRFVVAALIAIPLTPVMCALNIVLGLAGCTVLTKVIPKEGLF